MKRRRFKVVHGSLATKLAEKFDVSYAEGRDLDSVPQVALSELKVANPEIQQSAYIAPGGISYRVFSLTQCFKTSHSINKAKFLKRKTLVMVNGLTRTKDHWVGFDKLVAEEVNVVTLDPRGVGESRQKADWSLSIEQMSEDVKVVLDDLGIEKAFLLGFSLGGMIALMFGLRYPRRLYSLIVINSSMGGGARSPRLYPQSVVGLARSIMQGGRNFHHALSSYVLSVKTPEEMRKGAAQLWLNLEKRYGKNVMIMIKQLVAASRFRNPHKLKAIDIPTLVIFGEKDNFVPSSHSAHIFFHLAQSVLVGIEGGGHELHFDKPYELKKTVLSFIAGDFSSW